MILAPIQHYTDALNDTLKRAENQQVNSGRKSFVATSMLDCTNDLTVAASVAIMGNGNEKKGVVWHLLVDIPFAYRFYCNL